MKITFHRSIRFRRKSGKHGISLPGIQIQMKDRFIIVGFHGYHVMRIYS